MKWKNTPVAQAAFKRLKLFLKHRPFPGSDKEFKDFVKSNWSEHLEDSDNGIRALKQ